MALRMPSSVARPAPSTTASSPLSHRRPSISLLSRNIDSVILGDVQFDTWYYSPYPDSIILSSEPSTNSLRNGKVNGGAVSAPSPSAASTASTTCPILHVCPSCFRYTPHVSAYVAHLRHHQQLQKQDPKLPPVPESATPVYSYGGYSVWEVDGETEKLYCQNLSLFGKLFLEQKSVFFDTGGFLYYILTYTPPEDTSLAVRSPRKHNRKNSDVRDDLGLKTEVLGFFSKENPSWDNNNLACILIFPPYQHRQLGKLLMSVSYKLSGWEWEGGVIGGPEKPLSVMGRRSYLRFWSERVARFILGESADADGKKVFDDGRKRKRRKNAVKKETMTVQEIGERTGMLAEDVVAALTEMGLCEVIPTKKPRIKKSGETDGQGVPAASVGGDQDEDSVTMVVKRSRVMDWVQTRRMDLHDLVREEGFLGEWAMSEVEADDIDMGEDDNN
jgi:MOZ/SAS family/MYST family zinc finger domain